MSELTLYSYYRSSAAYRVRIVLALKSIPHRQEYVHLLRDGGEQHRSSYREMNPQGLVPVLQVDGMPITQSIAIIEYLNERFPDPPLLPADPLERAHVRSMAQLIACDIHPLNNLRVLRYLEQRLHLSEAERNAWYCHWVCEGFDALEKRLGKTDIVVEPGLYCWGEVVTMADVCLVPQVYNAYRFKVDMTAYPRLTSIYQACMKLASFQLAAPEAQDDLPAP